MADETKDSPAADRTGPGEPTPTSPKTTTEGARAETGAARTDAPPAAPPAATAETFKTAPVPGPTGDAPAVAGGTNAPRVSQPVAEKAAAKPAAAKPAAAKGEDMTRRGFFSWAAVAWVGFTAAIGGCVTAMGRFMVPNVLFEPPTTFKAGRPEDFQPGVVDTRLVDKYGVWIVNNGGQIYALIAICTHLGCPPAWLETQNKFKCPCHGSGYYKSGVNFEGPTPRPLERARIFISPDDGQVVVDKSQKFQQELGQWTDPNSFIPA